MTKIALLTCDELRSGTDEDRELASVLRHDFDAAADFVVWNDVGVGWDAYDVIIPRSCWDYHLHIELWYLWLDHAESFRGKLINPAKILRWNTNKRYLLELQTRGAAIVPSLIISSGAPDDIAAAVRATSWDRFVVKPCISMTSVDTHRLRVGDKIPEVPNVGDAGIIIQPYLSEIEHIGEHSLVFLEGEFAYAAIKTPKAGDFRVQEEFGGELNTVIAPQSLVDTCRTIVQLIDPVPYARVDGVITNGEFQLMELEVIDPAMYMVTDDQFHAFASVIMSAAS
jgi:glutathione synthase/RimK-type ligase-like ATP-grasp enzyme